MSEKRTKYDAEFREGAVRIVEETGKSVAAVARDLGVNEGTLGNWVVRARETRTGAKGLGHGLLNARVVGWAGAGKDFGPRVPAEIQVDLPEVTDLTAGDLARLDHVLSALVGVEVVTWAVRPGGADVLPGERVRCL